jgi:uncharacterized membrane protein
MAEPIDEHSVATLDPTKNNVEAIAKLEKEALHHRTAAERISDAITKFIGSMACVLLHVVWFAVWVLVNLNLIPGVSPFDPFPFGILTLIVSAEGVLLAIFILVSQNRMTRQSDRRAHLDLQVSMLAEQELTLMLQMQQRICKQLGIDVEGPKEEVQQFAQMTDVQHLVDELKEQLPEE